MQLLGLDANFNPVGYFGYTNLQWIRRYYEPGEFSVQIPIQMYMPNMAYVYTNERPEVGIVQKSEYQENYQGAYMQVSGYFFEYKINDKIIYPRYIKSGVIEDVAVDMAAKFYEDIPLLQIGASKKRGEAIAIQSTGKNLAAQLYEMLQTQEMSFRTRYAYEDNKMYFEVWQGLDRTMQQSENPFAIFSGQLRNIANEKIVIDDSAVKNYAVVIGNGQYEDGKQIEVIIDKSNGGYKQKVYIDKTSMRYEEDKQTLEDYKMSLTLAGLEEMQKSYSQVVNINVNTVDRGIKYLLDYDLGDKVEIVVEPLNTNLVTRIIEVNEVFKKGQHTVSLTFGTKVPRVYRKI